MTEQAKPTTLEEAKKAIQAHLKDAYASIAAAQEIADEFKTSFSFSVTYGMGGRYEGDPEERWSVYQDPEDHDGWHPSSVGC